MGVGPGCGPGGLPPPPPPPPPPLPPPANRSSTAPPPPKLLPSQHRTTAAAKIWAATVTASSPAAVVNVRFLNVANIIRPRNIIETVYRPITKQIIENADGSTLNSKLRFLALVAVFMMPDCHLRIHGNCHFGRHCRKRQDQHGS